MFVLVWCGSEKPPRQLQSAVPAFFSGCMVCKFTELRPWVGSAATPTVGLEPTTTRLRALRSTAELGGLLPKLQNLSTLHSITVVFHASTNCHLFLSTSCLLCRLVPFCSCFLAFCSAFISFASFSFVLAFFLVFCRFLFLFPSFCCLFPCLSLFCSLLLFFVFFPSFCCFFPPLSVRSFSFRLFFFAPLVPFSPLSFFLSPVSLALLLPPLLFGLFSSWNSCRYGASSSKDWLGYVEYA